MIRKCWTLDIGYHHQEPRTVVPTCSNNFIVDSLKKLAKELIEMGFKYCSKEFLNIGNYRSRKYLLVLAVRNGQRQDMFSSRQRSNISEMSERKKWIFLYGFFSRTLYSSRRVAKAFSNNDGQPRNLHYNTQ